MVEDWLQPESEQSSCWLCSTLKVLGSLSVSLTVVPPYRRCAPEPSSSASYRASRRFLQMGAHPSCLGRVNEQGFQGLTCTI